MARADRYTELNKKKDFFSDFLVDFTPHPNTKDLVRSTNEQAIKRSVRNLILTNKYERLMDPGLGSNIRKMLFEPITQTTSDTIKRYIEETINNHEPRVKLINTIVEPVEYNQSYRITIMFYIINRPEPVGMSVSLFRVR